MNRSDQVWVVLSSEGTFVGYAFEVQSSAPEKPITATRVKL